MIPAQTLTLSIINTEQNSMPIDEEFAQRGTLQLSYNGGDERGQYMMPSELNFSMEVIDARDLAFQHLFTGNETNYEVLLTNENDLVIWRGYLLPEQYEEPYEHKLLYVNFTATDGLARLKGKYLPDAFYTQRHSVITVLHRCLQLTNLELPIRFAPALKNDSPDIGSDWNKIFIDMATYVSGSDKLDDCYKIISSILETLGCSLFAYLDTWYITGHNRYGTPAVTSSVLQYYKYTASGAPDGFIDMAIDPVIIQMESTPQITLLPPLQKVTTAWDIDEREDILPENIISQPYEDLAEYQNPPAVLHWVTSAPGLQLGREVFGARRLPLSYGNYIGSNAAIDVAEAERRSNLISSAEFVALEYYSITPINNAGFYMELQEPVYLKSDPDTIDLDITMVGIFNFIDNSGPFPALDEDDYGNQNFNYEILYDGETMISNLPGYVNRDGYLLDITFEGTAVNDAENPKRIVGTLSIKEMQLPTTGGLLQVRIYALGNPQNNIKGYAVGCTNLSIKYSATEEEIIEVTRPIDWTTQYEVDAYHGGNLNDLSVSHFTLSNTDNAPANYIEHLALAKTPLYYGFVPPYSTVDYIEVSSTSFTALQNAVTNNEAIYGIKNGSTIYQSIRISYPANYQSNFNFQMFREYQGKFYVYLEYTDGSDFMYYTLFAQLVKDRLFIYSFTVPDPIDRRFRVLWSRVGAPVFYENAIYGELRAQIVHDTTPEVLVKFDTTVFGLLDPWSLKQFDIKGNKNFIVTDLKLQLDTGMSTATLVQSLHDNLVVTSYNE
jgi:hypothetical protein